MKALPSVATIIPTNIASSVLFLIPQRVSKWSRKKKRTQKNPWRNPDFDTHTHTHHLIATSGVANIGWDVWEISADLTQH